MKKKYLIVFIIFILILSLIGLINKENSTNYFIDDFEIEEKLINGKTHLTIKKDDKTYYYLFNENKGKKIVQKIDYYNDKEYSCIFLNFKDGTNINDLLCYKGKINYYLSTIKSKTPVLSSVFDALVRNNKIEIKTNDIFNSENIDLYRIYTNNIYDDLGLALTTYKGLYILSNKNFKEINLFDNDVYEQKVKTFIDDKYVIANYNQLYDFDSFYVVDLKSKKTEKIKIKYKLSFNSEIVHKEDNAIYLYDKDNNKNYKFDFKTKNIVLLKESPKYEIRMIDDYQILKEIDNNYYLIKNNSLYKINNDKIEELIYLLDLRDKSDIKIEGNYICWLENIDINCYYKNSFIKIASNNEFSFNKNISFQIFE